MIFKGKDYVSLELGRGSGRTKSTSLLRKWKQTTSYQKKFLFLGLGLFIILCVIYSSQSQVPVNGIDTSKRHVKLKSKRVSKIVEEDEEDQVHHPILEQLGEKKQQALKELENRIKDDFNQLQRPPPRRGNPKLIARFDKDEEQDEPKKGKVKKVSSKMDGRESEKAVESPTPSPKPRKEYPLPEWKPMVTSHNYTTKQEFVMNMFKHAWKGYKETAWGHDHSHPISRRFDDWFHVGLTLLDSIDTAFIMGLKAEYEEGRQWIAKSLTFDVDVDVNLFECTIRVLGSMLSAFHLTGDQLYKDRALDIGDRLLPALIRSVSSVPYSDVNLRTGNVHAPKWGPDSTVSEVTSIQMEFRDLSFVTGDPKYKDAVDKVTRHVEKLSGKKNGLVPMWINANTGMFRPGGTITVGARADSYYEYLLKQWVQTGRTETHLLTTYLEAIEGIQRHLIGSSFPSGYTYVGELLGGVTPSAKMDHLACFLPGTLALGSTLLPDSHKEDAASHMDLAKRLAETCYHMYSSTPTGLSPEIAYFNLKRDVKNDIIVKPLDRHNLLRPETVESLFYLWRITKNETYREWGWKITQAFEKYTKVPTGGYTSIKNVMNPSNPNPMDKLESFFLGETLKYLFLLFSDDDTFLSSSKWVFNTEAHPFPVRTSSDVS